MQQRDSDITSWPTQLWYEQTLVGQILKWSLKLSEFDVQYESRKALKSQALVDFVTDMTTYEPLTGGKQKWTIFVDGASSSTESKAGILLEI